MTDNLIAFPVPGPPPWWLEQDLGQHGAKVLLIAMYASLRALAVASGNEHLSLNGTINAALAGITGVSDSQDLIDAANAAGVYLSESPG